MTRIILLLAVLTQTAACVPVFDTKAPLVITFDAEPASVAPMNYADIMCCYDCTV
jgi:hypothetical protein